MLAKLEISGHVADTATLRVTHRDVAPIVSEAGRAKIVRAFRKTPFRFRFFVVSPQQETYSNGNEKREWNREYKSRLAAIRNRKASKSITVIYTHNATTRHDYMPMTAWILAHRVGHLNLVDNKLRNDYVFEAVRDEIMASCPPQVKERDVFPQLNYIDMSRLSYTVAWSDMESDDWRPIVASLLNTRCSRKSELVRDVEVFAELIAQYVITGKVTLAPVQMLRNRIAGIREFSSPNRLGETLAKRYWTNILTHYSDEVIQAMIMRLESKLAIELHKWLSGLVGKTWVF